MWNEKKFDWEKMHIRLKRSVALEVRDLAASERRHIQDQLAILVEERMEQIREANKETSGQIEGKPGLLRAEQGKEGKRRTA